MASQLDNIIKAQRFNTLKAQVKAECLRRKYVGSVEEFGGSSWDFDHIPFANTEIEAEQYRKISIPMRKINWKVLPNGPFERVVNDADLLTFETKVVAFKGRSITDQSATDCAASCTGTCTTSCTGSCGGSCSGTCSGSCKGNCTGSCSGSCVGGCTSCSDQTCKAECSAGCCGSGCQGTCNHSCGGSSKCKDGVECGCSETCSAACRDRCAGGCSGGCYTTSCTGHCGNSCSSCDGLPVGGTIPSEWR